MSRFVTASAEVPASGGASRFSLVGRVIDRGAITAAVVGLGMAVTLAISFLLIIPIEPVYWILSVPAGLLIGYYANARSGRGQGHWLRLFTNAVFAGAVTGLSLAVLLLGIKALFFIADDGYRDPGLGGRLTCTAGADCVYQRYLVNQSAALRSAGVTDAATFGSFYWAQQWSTAGLLLTVTTGSALAGGLVFGVTRPRSKVAAIVE